MFGFKASLLKTGETQMMDTLGIEPRAFRMRSGCDTATPCAPSSTRFAYVLCCDFCKKTLWASDLRSLIRPLKASYLFQVVS